MGSGAGSAGVIVALVIFWVASFLTVYPYAIYPPLIAWLARAFPRRPVYRSGEAVDGEEALDGNAGDASAESGQWPSVTQIVSAYNEAPLIESKLENSSAIDYAGDEFKVIVASDGSDDGTDDLVEAYSKDNPRIKLIRFEGRNGKTLVVNKVMQYVDTDITVFSDANAMYKPDAITNLVKPFFNPEVGYTVGASRYYVEDATDASKNETVYWDGELKMKRAESDFDSVVGGDGAIYAIRTSLFEEMHPGDLNDFINPIHIVDRGYRGVFVPEAECFEHAGETFAEEYNRRRRISNQAWCGVFRHRKRIGFGKNTRSLFMLLSHKFFRWHSLIFIVMAVLSGLYIVARTGSAFYSLLLLAIFASMVVAAIGYWYSKRGKELPTLLAAPFYFYLSAFASFEGIINNFRGENYAAWDHIRK